MRSRILPQIQDRALVRAVLDSRSIPEPNSGCWLWSSWATQGYGRLRHPENARLIVSAHRLSYEAEFGPIPPELIVCHKCDTPCCINPAHLFVGTDADNMRDRDSKGRVARGVGSKPRKVASNGERPLDYRAKLTRLQASEIRLLRSELAMPKSLIADMYGINRWNVRDILRGDTYKV